MSNNQQQTSSASITGTASITKNLTPLPDGTPPNGSMLNVVSPSQSPSVSPSSSPSPSPPPSPEISSNESPV